jgi:hypothetical protein
MSIFSGGPKPKPGERAQDLENLVGNYMITDHQLSRLRLRIHDYLTSYQKLPNKSIFMFRTDGDKKKWYEVRLEVNEIKIDDDSNSSSSSSNESEPEESPSTEDVEGGEQPTVTHFP